MVGHSKNEEDATASKEEWHDDERGTGGVWARILNHVENSRKKKVSGGVRRGRGECWRTQ